MYKYDVSIDKPNPEFLNILIIDSFCFKSVDTQGSDFIDTILNDHFNMI